MFFYLSKILLFLLKPLVWIGLLLLAALLTKDDIKRRKRLIIACVLVCLLSNNFLVNELLLVYEDRGTETLSEVYEAGIVLGGFSRRDSALGRTVFFEAGDRLLQAVREFKRGRVRKLMISGGSARIADQRNKEADAVKSYLLDIGIPDSCIIIENQSRNTYENIEFSGRILDSINIRSKVLIFSSAWHLPRVKLCLDNHLDADLYATHILSDQKRDFSPDNLLVPSAGALYRLELLLKEWVGYVSYMLRVS